MNRAKTYHQWRLSEVDFIRSNVHHLSNEELAKALNLNRNQVRSVFIKHGIKRESMVYSRRLETVKGRHWNDAEDEYLRMNYERFSAEFIGRKLNRTMSSIYRRAGILGLKKNKKWL